MKVTWHGFVEEKYKEYSYKRKGTLHMKKIVERGFVIVMLIMCSLMGKVNAFDAMGEADEVSREPLKAYGLYIGMPWENSIKVFEKLSNWSQCNGVSIFINKESINSNVKENVVIRKYSDENEVSYYRIYFMTDSWDIADRIYDTLSDNMESSLGKCRFKMDKKADPSQGINYYTKGKMWKSDGKYVCTEIVYSLTDNCNRYDNNGIVFKAKFAVSITRLIYKLI